GRSSSAPWSRACGSAPRSSASTGWPRSTMTRARPCAPSRTPEPSPGGWDREGAPPGEPDPGVGWDRAAPSRGTRRTRSRPMSTSSDERNPVELLAEDFLDRKRRGEHPTLQDYLERHPELAEEIRDLFPALLMMEDLG